MSERDICDLNSIKKIERLLYRRKKQLYGLQGKEKC